MTRMRAASGATTVQSHAYSASPVWDSASINPGLVRLGELLPRARACLHRPSTRQPSSTTTTSSPHHHLIPRAQFAERRHGFFCAGACNCCRPFLICCCCCCCCHSLPGSSREDTLNLLCRMPGAVVRSTLYASQPTPPSPSCFRRL